MRRKMEMWHRDSQHIVELEGTQQDHQTQFLGRWMVMGSGPTPVKVLSLWLPLEWKDFLKHVV